MGRRCAERSSTPTSGTPSWLARFISVRTANAGIHRSVKRFYAGADLLEGPITLVANVDGEHVAVAEARTEVSASSPSRVELSAKSSLKRLPVTSRIAVDYDGSIRVRLEVGRAVAGRRAHRDRSRDPPQRRPGQVPHRERPARRQVPDVLGKRRLLEGRLAPLLVWVRETSIAGSASSRTPPRVGWESSTQKIE